MGEITETTSELGTPIGLGNLGSIISSLRQYFSPRIRVIPIKINMIRMLYNIWIYHYHSYYDQYYIAYGNTGAHSTSGENRDSDRVRLSSLMPTEIEAGASHYSTFSDQIFQLISNFNSFVHKHAHMVRDDVGPTD